MYANYLHHSALYAKCPYYECFICKVTVTAHFCAAPLRPAALEMALQALLSRHEALRTGYRKDLAEHAGTGAAARLIPTHARRYIAVLLTSTLPPRP